MIVLLKLRLFKMVVVLHVLLNKYLIVLQTLVNIVLALDRYTEMEHVWFVLQDLIISKLQNHA